LQWQIGRISNFRDENSNDLYLQGRKTYLSLFLIAAEVPLWFDQDGGGYMLLQKLQGS